MNPLRHPGLRKALLIVGGVVALAGILAAEITWTRPVRQSVQSYIELMNASNREDIEAAKRLCSNRYLRLHPPNRAPEGGLVGLPRNIHKNYQAWRREGSIWICPTNRVGPLYRFIFEAGIWKFDGPIGMLLSRGRIELYSDPDEAVDEPP